MRVRNANCLAYGCLFLAPSCGPLSDGKGSSSEDSKETVLMLRNSRQYSKGSEVLDRFQNALTKKLESGRIPVSISETPRDCESKGGADGCYTLELAMSDGALLRVDTVLRVGEPLAKVSYERFLLGSGTPGTPNAKSICLREAMRKTKERGDKLVVFERMFSDQTAFFGFESGRFATLDVVSGECFDSQ